MKISFENYERCYPKRLKKFFQSSINYKTYDSFIPQMQRAVVGNIPPELIKLFPEATRGTDIKNFQNALGDISKYIRASYEKISHDKNFAYLDPETYRPSQAMKDWMNGVNNVFNGCLRRFSNTQLTGNLEYIDRGVAAKVFKMSIFDKNGKKVMHDKALKVYHQIKFMVPEFNGIHGNFAEANTWTYLKFNIGHNLDKTQFTKHYISDLHNGYGLTEFIDYNIAKTTAPVDFVKLFGIKYRDSVNNRPIYNKMYDLGGFDKTPDFTDDKVVLRFFKKLYYRSPKELPQTLSQLEALAQNPKTPHRNKIQQAIDLFNKKQA